jgi:hypothetical protein
MARHSIAVLVADVFYSRATSCERGGSVRCSRVCAKGCQCFEWRRRGDGATLVELEPLKDLYFVEPADPLVLGEVEEEVVVVDC